MDFVTFIHGSPPSVSCNEHGIKDVARMMKVHIERILNLFYPPHYQCKGRRNQLQDCTQREDGLWISKQGAPEDCDKLQMRKSTALSMNPHESAKAQNSINGIYGANHAKR